MTPDRLFELANAFALLGWLPLFFAPQWKWTTAISVGGVVSLLAATYATLLFQHIQFENFEDFQKLESLMALFSSKEAVLVGWVHYLAFDLMTGWFISQDALRLGVNKWLVLPCLLCTFMMGPFGLLLFLTLRLFKTKSWFTSSPFS